MRRSVLPSFALCLAVALTASAQAPEESTAGQDLAQKTQNPVFRNSWSVAGDSVRSDVNQTLIQYFVNYNLPNGWYLTSAPVFYTAMHPDSQPYPDWTARFQLQLLFPK